MQLNTTVIYGSVRSNRQGIKAARFTVRKLQERGHEVSLVDPDEYRIPFLDHMYKEYGVGAAPGPMETVAQILRGLMVSSLSVGSIITVRRRSEYLYKPSGIVTYSAGPFGGVRALITLRAILAELGTPSIPSAFPVSEVGSAFDAQGTAIDSSYDRRIVKFLDEFEWYATALKRARDEQGCTKYLPAQQAICQGRAEAG